MQLKFTWKGEDPRNLKGDLIHRFTGRTTETHRFISLQECTVRCFQRQLSTVVSFRAPGTNAQPRNTASCGNQKLR